MKKSSKTLKVLSFIMASFMMLCVGCGPTVNKDKDNSDLSGTQSESQESTDVSGTDSEEQESADEATSDSASGAASNTPSGSNKPAPGKKPGKNPGNGGGDINKIPENKGFKEPIYDLKGRVITIASENDLAKDKFILESVKLTEKKYNCKFKFVYKTDYFGLYETLINDHAAGSASFDVVELRGYDVYPNAANSGAIMDLSSVYDFKNDPTWQNDTFKVGMFKDKFYGISYTPNEVGTALWYNRALLREANVPDLWTYVDNDTWNFDTFRKVCRKLTRDTNGDGKPDVWAFTSEDPWIAFLAANGTSVFEMTKTGPKYTLNSSKALRAIDYVNSLFNDNTVPDGKELAAVTDNPFNAMTTGKVAMFPYHARYGAVLENFGIKSADIGWVYMPKGPDAKSYSTATITAPGMFVIPQDVSGAKELVAAVQDMAAYWDTERKIKHKVTDKTDDLFEALKTSLNGKAKEVLYYQATNPVYTFANNYGVGNILQEKVWADILSGKSPKTVVNSYASKIQTQLTNTYKGVTVS